ncbi:orotidine 5'-phosphate decarboxylase / HUMPS family protein [Lentilactobacillus kefiri]|uniref:3-hexulose-6-phosphate synthase n=2 Tax=Lentilactobacillus kefiri TaxID=33962 RepID=A0A8E1RLJ0_LENKE|nr:orotidine 5'-phosphate decarboxylase / HUMPS family protein [Lentilactobacillus kefiri]KRL75498.1 3-hexulose-6-phosphate synthase [Lentilactobacillus parakefiri DSM 10551]KRM53612.1 3-hexulose-6-phosphate synthase [Lentilactobacillus kefiri DSM 20587 = JCM 5818]MCJ2161083.1 orotidine 5'-phosphate decarboxylase [Lentilactobacillus kefiri]MCP9369380.1 orotidine 5'-phosphate decarboxylase [Lentilactobacillus kefiri]MDH5109364.1 orotidine 5'-phosphate decarboxylase [Lentilactobacillus kefiri]
MKLQAAIDRVSLGDAITLAHKLDGIADVIEFGTSLVKDYGLYMIKENPVNLKHSKLLLDLKTIDEGPYEFEKGFEANGDILTVMAGSSYDTISKIYDITEKQHKEMLIDLLEVDDDKIKEIANFDNAIYGLHHSKDAEGNFDAISATADFHQKFPAIKRVAVAGGIDFDQAKGLAEQGIADTVIVGGKIAGTDDPVKAATEFKEAMTI